MDLRWYKLLVKPKIPTKCLALFDCESVSSENVLVCQELKYRNFARFGGIHDLIKFTNKVKYSHNCLYEIIRSNFSHKWYADIDIVLEGFATEKSKCVLHAEETIEVVKEVKKALLALLPISEDDIMVASSNGEKKHSYHIVVDRWCLANREEAKAIYSNVIDMIPVKYRPALDLLYKSLQQFRLYGSHKFESERVKVFRTDLSSWKPIATPVDDKHLELLRFTSFLVGNISGCSYLPSFVSEKEIRNFDKDENSLNKEDTEKVLNLFRARYKEHSAFTYLCYDKCFITLKRIRPSYCASCSRSHEHENPYLLVVGPEKCIYFDCRRGGLDTPKLYLGKLGATEEETTEEVIEEEEIKPYSKLATSGLTVCKSTVKNVMKKEVKQVKRNNLDSVQLTPMTKEIEESENNLSLEEKEVEVEVEIVMSDAEILAIKLASNKEIESTSIDEVKKKKKEIKVVSKLKEKGDSIESQLTIGEGIQEARQKDKQSRSKKSSPVSYYDKDIPTTVVISKHNKSLAKSMADRFSN